MDVAAMNVRITFQKSEVISDAIGNRSNSWTDYYSCFATLSDSAGKSSVETAAAGLIVDHSDISFTVRFCSKSSIINSTDYRVLWNNEVYDILKVDHLNMKKCALKFKCEKARS